MPFIQETMIASDGPLTVSVPAQDFISFEHPGIVHNIENALTFIDEHEKVIACSF